MSILSTSALFYEESKQGSYGKNTAALEITAPAPHRYIRQEFLLLNVSRIVGRR